MVEREQHLAVNDLFFRHFVASRGGVWIGAAKPVRERTVKAIVLFLIRDREGQNFVLIEIGESLHALPLDLGIDRPAAYLPPGGIQPPGALRIS
jgi:hypothetical protein